MTILDDVLPRFTFRERHAITIAAPADRILACVRHYRAREDPLVRTAIRLRETPARLLGRSCRPPLDLDDFTPLGRAGDNELAMGLIGKFWKADYGLLPVTCAASFMACRRDDVCKLAMGFHVHPAPGGRSALMTETRVFCPTPAVLWRFAPYWYLIRPVSGLIRQRMLAMLRRQAEQGERVKDGGA
ncbi:hypothetical protein JCM25156A_19100 [Komagataeibacter kakiaceti JCM 25156]